MKEYKSEEEFLKDYNPNDYERPSITSDVLLFSVSDGIQTNYRKLKKKYFSVLLVKRDRYPFKDKWCIPGGFIRMNETCEETAARVLETETNLHNIFMEQLYTFDDINRDPRTRVISVVNMALVDKNKLDDTLYPKASWFNITMLEKDNICDFTLDNGNEQLKFKIKKVLKEKTTDRYKFEIAENDAIAFDHPLVIWAGIERLKNKISYTDVAFNMMPELFALGDLQQVYEVILNKKLLDPAFRRIIADKVEKTEFVKTGAGHRPSVLFRYKKKDTDK